MEDNYTFSGVKPSQAATVSVSDAPNMGEKKARLAYRNRLRNGCLHGDNTPKFFVESFISRCRCRDPTAKSCESPTLP